MTGKPVPTHALLLLTAVAVVLPIAICVLLALGRLLEGMGDATGRRVLDCVSLGAGVLWAVDLVSLVLIQAVNSLVDSARPPEESKKEEL